MIAISLPAAAVMLLLSIRAMTGAIPACQTAGNPQIAAPKTLLEQLEQADRFASQGEVEGAVKLYEAAAARARNEDNPVLESRALAAIGRLLNRTSKYAEARQYLENALKLAEVADEKTAVAQVANSLGMVAENMGQSKEARIWYQKSADSAAAAGDFRVRATALLNAASLTLTPGSDSSILIREAVEIGRSLADKELEARAWHIWGDLFFTLGDFSRAMEKLESASELYQQTGNRESLARVYTSMGRLHRMHGRPEAAIPLYEKARMIQQETNDALGVIQSLNATAVAYSNLDRHQRAREFYEKAYALALETNSPRAIDFMRANLAGGLLNLGEYARGAELLEEVLRRGVESYPAIRHTQLAYAYLSMGQLARARTNADKAVELSTDQPTQRPNALWRRACIRERQGDIAGAMEDMHEAIRVIEEMRAKLVPLDFMKQGFTAYFNNVYSTLIGLYVRQGQPERALEAAELARARAFLDLLATRDVRLKDASQAEVADLRQTDLRLRALGIDPFESTAAPFPLNLGAETAAMLAKWKATRPEILSFVAVRPQTIKELIATAGRLNSTILSYWTSEDALFIGVIQPQGKVEMRRVELPRQRLTEMIETALAVSERRSASGPVTRGEAGRIVGAGRGQNWQELYRILVDPIHRLLPPPGSRLTIIPHGPLMRLSFAALQDPEGRYLVETYALHYVPAGALLDFTAAQSSTASAIPRRYLFVADPVLPAARKGETPMPPLAGARDEVRAIARLVPAQTSTVLQGSQADRQTVASSMSQASVLHFATHGVMLDDRPLDSYLALGRPASTDGDGRLSAQDLYAFNLRAELVVLSSCRSGGGKVTGEGISALVRAFFYAGTPSIIASLWDVPDQPANRLLADFYASWLKGRSRADALRSAQLRMLSDLRADRLRIQTPAGDFTLPEDPILWAGFILQGEP